jgi:hypothetical protein
MRKLSGQINEGWLGEDRSSKERANGSEYVMDISIGPTCRVSFTVQARSLDEAKDIVRMQMQYHIDWPQEQLTPIESFWYETVPISHRSLSDDSRVWLARHVTKYGEEKTKEAISTAAKAVVNRTSEFATCEDLTSYVGGILRKRLKLPETIHVTGTASDTPSWKAEEPPPRPPGPPRREDFPSRLDYARACYQAGVPPEPRSKNQ